MPAPLQKGERANGQRSVGQAAFGQATNHRNIVKMCTLVDVSVIIVNWNRLDDVLKNLRNLRHQTELRTEIVVVDNGSTDGSAERLSELGWIRLIRLGTNVGPAEARNYGLRNASGEYIVFLDSDSLLPKSGLAKLVSRMEADPTIGIIACRIVNSRTRKIDAWIHALPGIEPRAPGI